MIKPSPFRKLVPPLIWPVGVLLIVGYCYLENRREPLPCAPSGRCAPMANAGRGGVVLDSAFAEHVGMVQGHTVTVGFSEADGIDLRIPLVVLLGGLLAIIVLRRRRLADAPPGREAD